MLCNARIPEESLLYFLAESTRIPHGINFEPIGKRQYVPAHLLLRLRLEFWVRPAVGTFRPTIPLLVISARTSRAGGVVGRRAAGRVSLFDATDGGRFEEVAWVRLVGTGDGVSTISQGTCLEVREIISDVIRERRGERTMDRRGIACFFASLKFLKGDMRGRVRTDGGNA